MNNLLFLQNNAGWVVFIIIIILLLIVFERENAPYFIAGIVVFPLIYEATLTGLEHLDSNIKDEVKMLSNTNFKVVKSVYLPMVFPYLFFV